MLVTAWKWVTRRPLSGVAVSLAVHLLLIAALLWVGGPSSVQTVKRGEPLFVELPQAEEKAQRGSPAPAEPAGPTPKAPPTPPAPRVAAAPPKPTPPPSRPEPRAPERTSTPSPPPSAPKPEASPPDAEALRTPPAPLRTEEARPSERSPAPETPPRETPPPSPAPRVAAVPEQPLQPTPDIRSALRRGGPGTGGAGGDGKAWAGIEGEPIPLDSTDPKFNDYLDRIRRMIKDKWGYPCIKDVATGHCDYKSARLVIVFGILKDGRVPTLEVAQQSGYGVYDDYAVNAIKLASPFPPVPASLMATAKSGSAGVKIVAAFQYVLVESSLTNVLR
jgi:outer membrane biosynthesis protein TonB